MTAQDLKNSILQLAMQGKLVEQRAEEGTAGELIEQIQIEKDRLIKEGKIRKEQPLPKITEEEILFEIPKSWEWERWGNLANSIQYGYNAPATPQGNIRIVRISDIQNNIVNWSTVPYCQISEEEIPMYLLSEDDLLFARTGGTVGKSYLVTNMTERAIYAGYLIRSNYNKRLCSKYLKYFMETPLYWSQLRNGTTQTTQPNCNGKTLSKMLVPIPPIEEQKRIVEKMDELIPYIERYEKAYSKLEILDKNFLEDMQKSILQYAMQGKLVEQKPEEGTGEELYCQIQIEKKKLIKTGIIKKEKPLSEITEEEKPFEIPKSWKWVKLNSLVTAITDGDHQPPPQVEVGVPFLVISNMSEGRLSFNNTRNVSQQYYDNLQDARKPKNGDILFTVTGSYGIVIPVKTDKAFCVQRHVAIIKKPFVSVDYLVKCLSAPYSYKQCKEKATGTAQKTVGLETLRNLILPLPPLEEQERIVAKLEEVLPFCKKIKKKED